MKTLTGPLFLALTLPLLQTPAGASTHQVTRIACESYRDQTIQSFVLHWDDGLEGSMTAEWRDESGETIGFYRQPAPDLNQDEWSVALPWEFQLSKNEGVIELRDASARATAECWVAR